MENIVTINTGVSFLKEVWRRFQLGDPRCRNTLIEAYLPLVRATAARMRARLPGQVELDDLISSGTVGLMSAIKSFDPERDVKFETYCLPRIRGAMLDELRSMDWVPRLARFRHQKLAQAVQALEATTGFKPTDAEIATELRIPMKEVRHMQSDSTIIAQISLDHPANDATDWDCRLGDTLPSRREDTPERQASWRDMREWIQRDLSPGERLVIVLYYYEGMTMREVGATLHLTESRISQMHSELLVRLRAKFGAIGTPPPPAADMPLPPIGPAVVQACQGPAPAWGRR